MEGTPLKVKVFLTENCHISLQELVEHSLEAGEAADWSSVNVEPTGLISRSVDLWGDVPGRQTLRDSECLLLTYMNI